MRPDLRQYARQLILLLCRDRPTTTLRWLAKTLPVKILTALDAQTLVAPGIGIGLRTAIMILARPRRSKVDAVGGGRCAQTGLTAATTRPGPAGTSAALGRSDRDRCRRPATRPAAAPTAGRALRRSAAGSGRSRSSLRRDTMVPAGRRRPRSFTGDHVSLPAPRRCPCRSLAGQLPSSVLT